MHSTVTKLIFIRLSSIIKSISIY